MSYEERIQQLKDEFSKNSHKLLVADSEGCIMVRTNLYAYGDVLFKDIRGDDEPDYIYANPSIYVINKNYSVVVNEEGSQLELIDSSSGLLKSIHISHDMELIRHIENILEFYVKNK